jgi:adenylate kinase
MAPSLRGPRLVILGRQGSGKGTQGARLARHLGLVHLSTGTLLRRAVDERTPLGRRVQRYLNQGRLVPDPLVLGLVDAELADDEVVRRGFLLDGFPRTVAQAQGLLSSLGNAGLDAAINLDVPVEEVQRRLASRRVCRRCDTPTVALGGELVVRCPSCGGEAVVRQDDTPEAIARRLAAHEVESVPLLALFERQGVLLTVDALGDPDEVFDRLLRRLRPAIWGTGEAVG